MLAAERHGGRCLQNIEMRELFFGRSLDLSEDLRPKAQDLTGYGFILSAEPLLHKPAVIFGGVNPEGWLIYYPDQDRITGVKDAELLQLLYFLCRRGG